MSSLPMVLKPRMSEKAYQMSKQLNTFIFDVPVGVSKLAVAQAVKEQFKVNVTSVNIMKQSGKIKSSYKKTAGTIKGQRNHVKRAYVTIKKGETIPVYAAIDEQEAKAKKAEAKAAKAGEK